MAIVSPIALFKPYQRRVYDDAERFIAWCAGRQVGKSFTGAGRAVKIAFSKPKTDVLIASPSERQSLEAMGKVKDWVQAFDLTIKDECIEREGGRDSLMKSDTVILPNGSRLIAVPGKPDTVRGFSAHVWMDEFAFFEDPDATWKAILPAISNPLKGLKTAFITSTPNGKSGRGKRFYEIVTDKGTIDPEGLYDYRSGVWSVHRTPITYAAPYLGTDLAALEKAVDDEEAWKQEFLCGFIDGTNVLLPYDVIARCESLQAMTSGVSFHEKGTFYAGLDFGRTNDPTVLWLLEQIGDILWTRAVIALRNTNTVDQFALLKPYFDLCTHVCLDYTGPGVGFGDIVAKHYSTSRTPDPSAKVELCTFTQPFKCEIFPKLRAAFDGVKLRIPQDVEVREDLHEMQQVINNGKYNYMARRTAEGHSDRCTALALANRAAGQGGEYVKPFTTSRRASYELRRIY